MRIGIDISVLNDRNRTGIGVYTYELIKNYLDLDKENEIILFGFSTFLTEQYLKNIFKTNKRVKVKVVKLPARIFRVFFLFWQRINYPTIENFIGRVDIYHSFNWYLPPQKYGKKVATVFDLTAIKFPELHLTATTQLDKTRFERINKYADLVIAISKSARRDFLNLYPQKKVEIVYPSTQAIFDQKIKTDKNKKLLKKYKIEKGYILAVGTLEPRKNFVSLIKAYLEIETDKKLVLVGSLGWKNDEVNMLIDTNKDKIIKTGYVSNQELVLLYKYAYCLVYPSFYEGFGIPVLSALKLGIPVISSNTSSLPEVGGKAILYIDPNNYKTIKKALNKLLSDKKLIKILSNAGRKQAKQFSYKKSARKLKDIYESLTGLTKTDAKLIHKRK